MSGITEFIMIHDCPKKEVYRKSLDNESYIIINYLDTYDKYKMFIDINTFLYENIPKTLECKVPLIFTTNSHCIEMEDCGYMTLLDKGYDFNNYRDIIVWLAHLDKIYLEKNVIYSIKKNKYFVDTIIRELSNIKSNKYFIDIDTINEIVDKISEIPRTICHKNLSSKNIMINNYGEPRILNVENMCIGPVGYDLASLLYNNEHVKEDDAIALIRLYSLLIGVDFKEVSSWIKICKKIIKILPI